MFRSSKARAAGFEQSEQKCLSFPIFFGIYIRMYHDDHNPPHFHIEYQGHEALMAIETGEILLGKLPNKAVKLVREWAKEHHDELLTDWQYAIELKPLQRIPGADND